MKGQFPAILPLGSLNGQNGFKLDGEATNDYSGVSVSSAGDINGDGHGDLVIGAYFHGNSVGRSYVVWGGPGAGVSGLVALSGLNGTNGFKLDGEMVGDDSGVSVSSAGDINGDGYADLLIGADSHVSGTYTGRSYAVLGGPGVGASGLVALSGLDGTNGFKLDGEAAYDDSGSPVSAAGDINGDGYADLLIGAQGHASYTGRSYAVLGGPGVGASGLVALSGLNGTNGFKLDGEASGDYSGLPVSTAGDINGDGHADLLIGADFHANQTGRSYVVFGGLGVGTSGLVALSGLNGTNGFKLDGEAVNDRSGYSLSAAGDINGDGYADLLIGAYGHASQTGRSYVVFGGPGVGTSGLVALSGLNGTNGFKLDGEALGDYSGLSVSTAGDINGDGHADLLIGADFHASHTGRSYVVFGGPGVGTSGLVALSGLNGTNGFKLDGEAVNDRSGYSVSAAGDINGDGVADLLIGASGHASYTGRSYVVFGDVPPVLVNNSLSLSVGAAIQLNSAYLSAYDRNHNNNTLVFIPGGITHGQFESMGAPGVPLVNFTQQQVISGAIQFVHDGTLVAPSYNITVRSDGIAWTGPSPAQITFIGAPPSYFPAILPLASLNGQIGFKIDGEAPGEQIGVSTDSADVNGDGYADILIGAPQYNGSMRSYVVYGGVEIGNNGVLSLSNLNGTNGFKLDGEATGGVVSSAGDVNGDGITDQLIGATSWNNNTGRTYLVFSEPNKSNVTTISLSSLNGVSGFKLDGEKVNDLSSLWGASARDMNKDGYADFLIGAPGSWLGGLNTLSPGYTYLVFGGAHIGNSSLINLSSLNGNNGFKLIGENAMDFSGTSVAGGGDFNGDGYGDLFIGAYGHSNVKGRSYVVFGGPGLSNNGPLSLANLNGKNGFKIDGELSGDQSGIYGNQGDINGDGYSDVLISAVCYNSCVGRSYILFGSPNIGSSGLISLNNLNGTNGFKLDGVSANDLSGYSIGSGDFNGDGIADLSLGAPGMYIYGPYTSSPGYGYVIFGAVNMGNEGLSNLSGLNGINGFRLDGEVANDRSSHSIHIAGDVNGDGISDLVVGAYNHNNLGRTYVVFGDAPPTLVQNRLSLALGQTINLNQTHLSAYDRNHPNNTIVFIPSNVTHGRFQLATQPGMSLTNFTLPQLQSGVVQFVHDGSVTAPSYHITVQSAGIAWTGPSVANITFIPVVTTTVVSTSTTTQTPTPTSVPSTPMPTATPTSSSAFPVLLNNQLTLSNGQTVVLSASNLQASETGFNNSQLIFSVGNVQNGYFANVPIGTSASKNLTSFTQEQVQSGAIEFVHDGHDQAPGYSVLVSDGTQSTSPSVAMIDFAGAPIITRNQLNITVGGIITLTPALLNVTVTDGSTPNQVVLTVSNLQHAVITSKVTDMPINSFTLAEIEAGDVELTQDGSLITPSYTLVAQSATGQSSAPSQVQVYFSNQGVYAPQLVNNYLTVTQGQATVLSTRYLSAQQSFTGQALNNLTMFYVSNLEYGHFSLTSQPQTWMSSFSQQQLLEGQVQFVQDGSSLVPGYQIEVETSNLFRRQ